MRILTAGGPIDQTHVFATWAFWLGIQGGDIPLGASVSLFMVPILAVAAIFILRDIHRRGTRHNVHDRSVATTDAPRAPARDTAA